MFEWDCGIYGVGVGDVVGRGFSCEVELDFGFEGAAGQGEGGSVGELNLPALGPDCLRLALGFAFFYSKWQEEKGWAVSLFRTGGEQDEQGCCNCDGFHGFLRFFWFLFLLFVCGNGCQFFCFVCRELRVWPCGSSHIYWKSIDFTEFQ